MHKLTAENQGYVDRLQRAESWVQRAHDFQEWDDDHGRFIFYWIALNALYGRHQESRRSEESDLNWFLHRICDLDQDTGAILKGLQGIKRKADRLLKDKFLLERYWREGASAAVKRVLDEDYGEAQKAFEKRKFEVYLKTLFKRLQVLRNQIFHGCSTDRNSLNKTSLQPAAEILDELLSLFVVVIREKGKNHDWPNIPFPRKGSPHHPN